MGEHKSNPTAIAAKKGELPPKPQKLSKRHRQALMRQMILAKMHEETGLGCIYEQLGGY